MMVEILQNAGIHVEMFYLWTDNICMSQLVNTLINC